MKQINLYQPAIKRQIPFSAWMILQITAVFIVGLAVVYGFAYENVADQEQKITMTDQQLQKLAEQIQSLPKPQKPVPSRSLEAQLHKAEQALEQKQQLEKGLETHPVSAISTGFSRYLVALARQRLDGLWLTQINVQNNGAITLEGATEAPDLVPHYLTQLGHEAAFSNTDFTYLHMVRSEEATSSPIVKFIVSTTAQMPSSKPQSP